MSAAIIPQGAGPAAELETPAPPEAERLISDPETLRAMADPLRLRILEAMVTRVAEPWSVKELAATLGVPPTRLYHHVDLLLERDLLRPAAQRLVSGIVETRYQVAALSLRLDPKLLSSEGDPEATNALIANVLDTARGEILEALRVASAKPEAMPPDRPVVSRGRARLTPERAAELRSRLVALLEEFNDDEVAGSRTYGLLLGFYPIASNPKGADEP